MGRFENIADISFIDGISISQLETDCAAKWRERYKELSGTDADIPIEEQCHIHAYCLQLYQLAQSINEKAKQNLLNYATGTYLDNIALNRSCTRKQPECSIVSMKFKLSAPQSSIISIPKGTRVTSSAAKIYFCTTEYSEIPVGETEVIIPCQALTGGKEGNNFAVGEINVLVDTIAYISEVSNTDVPTGGADTEDDDTFAKRIFDSKNIYNTTGAEDAYIYYIKQFSSSIIDVYPSNPQGAELIFYILTEDKKPASEAFLRELTDYITVPSLKAMTDHVTIKNAVRTDYSLDIGYYIASSASDNITNIQKNVLAAVEEYKQWQSEKIGRDINPQKLISFMIKAGVKRVVLSSSENIVVAAEHIANCISTNIEYLGLETD